MRAWSAWGWYNAIKNDRVPEKIGKMAANRFVISRTRKAISKKMTKVITMHRRKRTANDIFKGRTIPTSMPAGFRRMVIIYHDADKAGRHLDIHIGEFSHAPSNHVSSTALDHGDSLDTAGRLHIDTELMGELKQIVAKVKPQEILFVAVLPWDSLLKLRSQQFPLRGFFHCGRALPLLSRVS